MRVSIIFEDGVIVLDQVARSGFNFSQVDPNWRALQWLGDEGWIEVHRGDRVWLSDTNVVQSFIEMYNSQEGGGS